MSCVPSELVVSRLAVLLAVTLSGVDAAQALDRFVSSPSGNTSGDVATISESQNQTKPQWTARLFANSSCLPISLSPCLPISLSPRLLIRRRSKRQRLLAVAEIQQIHWMQNPQDVPL